jgi:hypothetical protein
MSIYVKTFAAVLCLVALNVRTTVAQAPSRGCSKIRDQYSCDKPQFTQALKNARTVAVETQPLNQVSAKALVDLARQLGKAVDPGSPDLIFELEPAAADGVYYGPNDRELAVLRVFARGANGGRGPLLWTESFVGQPDMAWAMVVHGEMQQFRSEFK